MDNYSKNFQGMSLITATLPELQGKKEDEAWDYLMPENVNRRENIASMFISEFLTENINKQYTVTEIKKILENQYELEMEVKAVRRILMTMAVNSELIWAKHGEQHNREMYFWYSKEKPADSITIDDLGELYSGEEY